AETTADPYSYGFRLERCPADVLVFLHTVLSNAQGAPGWVLEGDITSCFDNIEHAYVLDAIGEIPGRELIKQWLKAGYVEHKRWHPTDAGCPQGGVISPLLANIALHGMEKALGIGYQPQKDGERCVGSRALVRYADDFVVFCESREEAGQVIDILREWLATRGLTLSEDKTRIVHLTEGFDFLGFSIRQYSNIRRRKGAVRIIKPSKEAIKRHRDKMRDEWLQLRRGHPSKR